MTEQEINKLAEKEFPAINQSEFNEEEYDDLKWNRKNRIHGFIRGCKKALETNKWTDEDMINFAYYYAKKKHLVTFADELLEQFKNSRK